MVPMRAMHMAVLELLRGRCAHRGHGACELQRPPGKSMVAVHHDLVFGHISHGVDQGRAGFDSTSLEPHTDRDVGGKLAARLEVPEYSMIYADTRSGRPTVEIHYLD